MLPIKPLKLPWESLWCLIPLQGLTEGTQQGTRTDQRCLDGALVHVDMDSLRGAVESRGDSYITEITRDILPDELCTGRNEIINATQILHFLGLACTITFLTTFL